MYRSVGQSVNSSNNQIFFVSIFYFWWNGTAKLLINILSKNIFAFIPRWNPIFNLMLSQDRWFEADKKNTIVNNEQLMKMSNSNGLKQYTEWWCEWVRKVLVAFLLLDYLHLFTILEVYRLKTKTNLWFRALSLIAFWIWQYMCYVYHWDVKERMFFLLRFLPMWIIWENMNKKNFIREIYRAWVGLWFCRRQLAVTSTSHAHIYYIYVRFSTSQWWMWCKN